MTHDHASAVVLEHLSWARAEGLGVEECVAALGETLTAPARSWDDVFALYACAYMAIPHQRGA